MATSTTSVVDPDSKMRAKDVNKVVRGELPTRPPREGEPAGSGSAVSGGEAPPKLPDSSVGEGDDGEEEEIKIEFKTAPYDWRFPNTNQTRHCYIRYLEFQRCVKAKGEDAVECVKFAKYYRSLCPAEWIEAWNEQRRLGIFPGPDDI